MSAPRLKVYTCNNFVGYNPVGTAVVIVAPSEERAKALLLLRLQKLGLHQPFEAEQRLQIVEVSTKKESISILCTGNY